MGARGKVHRIRAQVDLAGSERVGKTGVKEKLLTEAVSINQALFFLEQVLT